MNTLSIRTRLRNAAAVFSACSGALTRQAEQAGGRRQTGSQPAREIGRSLRREAPASPPAPAAVFDEPTQRRLAVTASAMAIRTRPIEDRSRVILAGEGPNPCSGSNDRDPGG
jgi:hypothetical protein